MRAISLAATLGGAGLAGAARVLAAARTPAKPLHPVGTVVRARLHRYGAQPPTGEPWLDAGGSDDAIVRFSRGIGLPGWCPDVLGLAVRVDPEGAHSDVLFATTGWSRLTRFLLRPALDAQGPMTTLLPYRTTHGPLVLGARHVAADTYELSCALGSGAWRPFGSLVVDRAASDGDAALAFDPLLNVVPGLGHYGWVRRLREPAYRTARRHRPSARSVHWIAPVSPGRRG